MIVPVSAFLVQTLRGGLAERNQQFRSQVERMAARVNEMTHLIPITRAHGLEQDAIERVDESLSSVRRAGLELDMTTAVFGSLSWVTYNLFNILCLAAAAWVAYHQILPITAGDVVMLSGYFASLTGAVMALVSLMPPITKGMESLLSVGEVLQAPDLEQNEGKTPVEAVRGEFRFEKVSFHYPDTDVSAISDFSLEVPAGRTLPLWGLLARANPLC